MSCRLLFALLPHSFKHHPLQLLHQHSFLQSRLREPLHDLGVSVLLHQRPASVGCQLQSNLFEAFPEVAVAGTGEGNTDFENLRIHKQWLYTPFSSVRPSSPKQTKAGGGAPWVAPAAPPGRPPKYRRVAEMHHHFPPVQESEWDRKDQNCEFPPSG